MNFFFCQSKGNLEHKISSNAFALLGSVLILLRTQFNGRLLDTVGDQKDLETIIAFVAQLDEYIGVSNTNMHLRLAVGKSARVLVPHPADYRWMSKDQSPWFPNFEVYRQSIDGTWEEAFASLTSDLRVLRG